MIEIKTQLQFDNLNATISGLSATNPEIIRIYALSDGLAYQSVSPILILRSNVTIEGFNKPIIQSTNQEITDLAGSTIKCIGASGSEIENITIRGLIIKGSAGTYKGANAIYCSYVGKTFTSGLTSGSYSRYNVATSGTSYVQKIGITIKDCILDNNYYTGIRLNYSNNSIISGNIVSANLSIGILLSSSSSNIIVNNISTKNIDSGINIQSNSNNNTIKGNIVQNCYQGITINNSKSNTVTNNTIENCTVTGLYFCYGAAFNSASANTVKNCVSYGVYIKSCSNNVLSGNIVHNNNSWGIYLNSANTNIISSNNVSYSSNGGITLNAYCSDNSLSENITMNNGNYGISVDTSNSVSNIIYSNVSLNNTNGQYINGGSTTSFNTSYNV